MYAHVMIFSLEISIEITLLVFEERNPEMAMQRF